MAYKSYNENPCGNAGAIDCTVRAISVATGLDWETVYIGLCLQGFTMCDMPSSDEVWGAYLQGHGFVPYFLPSSIRDGYTVMDFCKQHPRGTYVVKVGSHVVCVVNGDYYDSWDSGGRIPLYFYAKGGE